MLASDVNNREFVGATDPDSVMIARFYMRAIKQEFISKKREGLSSRMFCIANTTRRGLLIL